MMLICPIPTVGATVLMIDEANCFDRMNLDCKLHIFEDHLIIAHTPRQGDNIKIIISKPDSDPRLKEFLQSIIHTMDNQRITVNNRFVFEQDFFLCHKTSPSSRLKN